MSTPHIQDLSESDDLTVSGSSVPSDPVNFETGWLVSCQTWWKMMDWTWKMLMLGIDMSWWILLLWCIDWTESLIPVLVCTLHIINHASLEHGINTIAAANKAPEGVYLLSKQKIGYDFWDKKTATPARGNAWLWHYHLHFGFYRYMYIHMIYVYSQSLSGQTFGRFEMEVFSSKQLPPCRRLSVGRKLWRDVMGGEVKHVSLT